MLYKKTLISLSLLLINPFLAAIHAIINSNKNYLLSTLIVSGFIGICAYNLNPYDTMDIVNYYNRYEELKGLTFSQIATTYNFDLFMFLFVKLIQTLGLNKEFVPFFVVLISYSVVFYTSYLLIKYKSNEMKNVHVAFIVILTVSFVNNAVGLRSGLSTSLFCLSLTYVYIEKISFKCLVIFILSCFVHSYVLLGGFCIFLSSLIGEDKYKTIKVILIISPIFVVTNIGSHILLFALDFLPSDFATYLRVAYIEDERWGANVDLSMKTFIVSQVLTALPFYASYLFLCFNKIDNFLRKSTAFLIIITFMLWGFFTISDRFRYLVQMMSLLYIIDAVLEVNKHKLLVIIFVSSTAISTLWGAYRFRPVIIDSYSFIYLPTIVSFYNTIDLNNLRHIKN